MKRVLWIGILCVVATCSQALAKDIVRVRPAISFCKELPDLGEALITSHDDCKEAISDAIDNEESARAFVLQMCQPTEGPFSARVNSGALQQLQIDEIVSCLESGAKAFPELREKIAPIHRSCKAFQAEVTAAFQNSVIVGGTAKIATDDLESLDATGNQTCVDPLNDSLTGLDPNAQTTSLNGPQTGAAKHSTASSKSLAESAGGSDAQTQGHVSANSGD